MPKGPFTTSGPQPHDGWTISGARDAKTGLGYGILQPKTQFPRQMASQFPYVEEETLGDDDFDEESATAVSKKYQAYVPSDFLRAAGNQPGYFVGGNTKLSDCFWKTDEVLQEIATFSDSMSPMGGQQHKAMGAALGGSGASFPYPGGGGSSYKRTGTTRGWAGSPPENMQQSEKSVEHDESEEILTLKDLADKIMLDRGENFYK
jgi:hypothetical protein